MAVGQGATSESILQDPFTLGRQVTQTSLEADIEVPENSAPPFCSGTHGRGRGGQSPAGSSRQYVTPGWVTEERRVLLMDVLGSRVGGLAGGASPPAAVASLDGWDPFVVLVVEEGLLPWDLWLVCG